MLKKSNNNNFSIFLESSFTIAKKKNFIYLVDTFFNNNLNNLLLK